MAYGTQALGDSINYSTAAVLIYVDNLAICKSDFFYRSSQTILEPSPFELSKPKYAFSQQNTLFWK